MPIKLKSMDQWIGDHIRQEIDSTPERYIGSDGVGKVRVVTAAKKFWKSRTIWLNGLGIVFFGLVELEDHIRNALPDWLSPSIILGIGVINIILRVFTVSPLTFSNPKGDYPHDSDSAYRYHSQYRWDSHLPCGDVYRTRAIREDLPEGPDTTPDYPAGSPDGESKGHPSGRPIGSFKDH